MSDTVGQMTIDDKTANQIYKYLVKHDYVDEDDGLSASFQEHKEAGTLPTLPEDLRPFADSIIKLIGSVVNPKLPEGMVNNGNTQTIKLNQANLNKKEFQALWRRINQKAIYQIELDSEKLINESIKAVEKASRDKNHHFVPSLTYTSEVLSKPTRSVMINLGQSKTSKKPKVTPSSIISTPKPSCSMIWLDKSPNVPI